MTTYHATFGFGARAANLPGNSIDRQFDRIGAAVSALDDEYGIAATDVAFRNPGSSSADGDWEEQERHTALVNPHWMGADGAANMPADVDTALWHIPTRDYTPASPADVYGPLAGLLASGRCEGEVFGRFDLYRDGGEQSIDVFIDDPDLRVEFEHRGESAQLILGFETKNNYFGSVKHQANVIAYDPERNVVLRRLSDRRKRMHTGTSPADVSSWWQDMYDELEQASDELAGVLLDADLYEVDLDALGMTTTELFANSDFPSGSVNSLANEAGARLARAAGGKSATVTAWQVYCAGTHVLTHDYTGKVCGSAFKKKAAGMNEWLFVPEVAERTMLKKAHNEREAAKREVEAAADKGDLSQSTVELYGKVEAAEKAADPEEPSAIERRISDLGEGVDAHRTMQGRMRELFRRVDGDTEADTADAEGGETGAAEEATPADD